MNGLPSLEEMSRELKDLCARSDAARRALSAVQEGVFVHPDGRRDELGIVRLSATQLALLAHLAAIAVPDITVDVGFGMGTSATIIAAARAAKGRKFQHFAFDPFGLPDGAGLVVQSYLEASYPFNFKRVAMLSEIGLGRLVSERGPECSGLIMIDGDHRFDQVITDFFLADKLCAVGGFIVFDDALFPAIEAAVNYVAANRSDYEVVKLPVWNTSLARKIKRQRPNWDSYTPFEVPQRVNWTAAPVKMPRDLPE
jgi:predicted O-methyltransferase YrrM